MDKRSIIGNLSIAIGWSIGGVAEVFLLKAIGDWRLFHKILFMQAIVVFISPL